MFRRDACDKLLYKVYYPRTARGGRVQGGEEQRGGRLRPPRQQRKQDRGRGQ